MLMKTVVYKKNNNNMEQIFKILIYHILHIYSDNIKSLNYVIDFSHYCF